MKLSRSSTSAGTLNVCDNLGGSQGLGFLCEIKGRGYWDVTVWLGEESLDLICLLGDRSEGAAFDRAFRARVLRCWYAFGDRFRHIDQLGDKAIL